MAGIKTNEDMINAPNTAVAYPIGIVFAIAMLAIFIHATKKRTPTGYATAVL